ncbi:MAG TPA: acetyl-CoA carboxylase biotin carboxylase subunit [Geminicoccaceae bacterium]|nr:acetyl-CoA carboxylase biotin carboxylase subunit [Geminicoccaceae bacterium]
MIGKILIANRGEVALRVVRACRELGIEPVAVHSTADAEAMHVRLADASVCIGPPPAADSYLNKLAIMAAAEISGADAIHPGYGFLSENADFAQMVIEHGYAFIGPKPEHIRLMGDKIAAKEAMRSLGVPVVPGTDGPLLHEVMAREAAERIGYPVLIKAVAGGGGRGMTIARNETELIDGMTLARREAKAGFGDDRVYLEKYLERPRHIEVQILADEHGNCIHLGERDCTVQRRHQKLIEEAPSPVLDQEQRAAIGKRCADAIRRLGYRGVGTVEMLYEDGAFYFIEMNTRLQVEHPVTEAVTGIDLVKEQISVADGQRLAIRQGDVRFSGHAIECRVNAEDPKSLLPTPGTVQTYHPPGGPGVRVDSALYAGAVVPPFYDSLIAKLVVHDHSREACLARARRALAEYVIAGLSTNLPLLQAVLEQKAFATGAYHTGWLAGFLAEWQARD